MASTTHYASPCANVVSRASISAGKSETAGMPHLGGAARRRPGPRDTARAHQASGRESPSEHGDRHQPNTAGRGLWPVIRPHFVPRAAFSVATTALCPKVVGNATLCDNVRREDGCVQDAAPGRGRAPSARPQAHYLGTAGQWPGAPHRARQPSADHHARIFQVK